MVSQLTAMTEVEGHSLLIKEFCEDKTVQYSVSAVCLRVPGDCIEVGLPTQQVPASSCTRAELLWPACTPAALLPSLSTHCVPYHIFVHARPGIPHMVQGTVCMYVSVSKQ